ncbi:hypothetical protein BDR22DRAFT_880079 [Usnea florida]
MASTEDSSMPARENESSTPSPQIPLSAVGGMDDTLTRVRSSTASSGRVRSASLRFLESSPPVGMWQATGNALAQAPTPAEIRYGSFSHDGWDREMQRRNSTISEENVDPLDERDSTRRLPKKFQDATGEPVFVTGEKLTTITTGTARPSSSSSTSKEPGPNAEGVYPNGYKFPPKHTWGEATKIGLKAFWKFTITPLGFLIVIYGLNVVAWGGMLFLLLIGGGQEFMCYPPGSHGQKDCNNINSPRRIWIEIDSQILNALFCVTGFGLIPWRFRDFYYLLKFRLGHNQSALRRLAGIHRSWFRLAGSENLPTAPDAPVDDPPNNPAIPLPPSKIPDAPLTGVRAPATRLWKLDYVILAFVLNTFLQAVLSGFMWGFNRYKRPSWSTGTFVALACIVAGLGGLMSFQEGKRVKKFEGIPVKAEEDCRAFESENGLACLVRAYSPSPRSHLTEYVFTARFNREEVDNHDR